MSQPIEMAVRIDITVLQSIEIALEIAVRRDILCHRVNNRETSGGIKLCHSQ